MSQTNSFINLLYNLNDGKILPQLKDTIPINKFYDSPYLDKKIEAYKKNHVDASEIELLKYLQSLDSDASLLLRNISLPNQNTCINTYTFNETLGREKEYQLLNIFLNRQYKNNIVLVGHSGVGKTTFLLSYFQKNKLNYIDVSLSQLVSNTKYRGEFENKLHKIIDQAVLQNALLFFDEIHLLLNTGNSEGGISAGNILKPLITKSNIQIIGATTPDEVSILYKDKAFKRRFNFLVLEEPDNATLKTIFNNVTTKLAIDDPINEKYEVIVDFLNTQFPDRYYPDKLIDFMDFYISAKVALNLSINDSIDLFKQAQYTDK